MYHRFNAQQCFETCRFCGALPEELSGPFCQWCKTSLQHGTRITPADFAGLVDTACKPTVNTAALRRVPTKD